MVKIKKQKTQNKLTDLLEYSNIPRNWDSLSAKKSKFIASGLIK